MVSPEFVRRLQWVLQIFIVGVASIVAFVATSPYTLLHYQATLREFRAIRTVLYGLEGPMAISIHVEETFPVGFGWLFFLLALAAVTRAVWKRRPIDLALLAFALPSFCSVATVRWVFPRYLIPFVPVLAVMTAEFVVCLFAGPARRLGTAPLQALALFTVLGLVMPGILRSAYFDSIASRKDTRLLAAEWVAQNVPKRETLLLCRGYGAPDINKDRRRAPAFDPQTLSCSEGALSEATARFVITHDHPILTQYSKLPPSLESYLNRHADPLAVFDPFTEKYRAGAVEPYFYGGDAFYIPFSGFGAVERGGPIVTIWALKKVD